jgi:hypothetical protein
MIWRNYAGSSCPQTFYSFVHPARLLSEKKRQDDRNEIVEIGVIMILGKMKITLPDKSGEPVNYHLNDGNRLIELNTLIGKEIQLEFTGNIYCGNCLKKTRKSYSQGYCYPCSQKLAACDLCIVRPERCHFDEGTCREEAWGLSHCMQDHYVYLANSSGLKVGITRATQIPTRWLDQGAIQAIKLFRAETRYDSGLLEVVLSSFVSDKTNWRKMLSGGVKELDMKQEAEKLLTTAGKNIAALRSSRDSEALVLLENEPVHTFHYPVDNFPAKIVSLSVDKNPLVCGVLQGIKGQYLILDTGVINIRKYTSYEVRFSIL